MADWLDNLFLPIIAGLIILLIEYKSGWFFTQSRSKDKRSPKPNEIENQINNPPNKKIDAIWLKLIALLLPLVSTGLLLWLMVSNQP